MGAHSTVVGGSTAARVMACTASVLHNRQFPNESSSYAEEGTALHEAIAFILDGHTKEDRDVIGMTFNKYVITEDLFDEALKPALAFFDELDEEYGGLEFETEKRVRFRGIKQAFGTVDIIGKGKIKRTLILDWKFGVGVAVYAQENKQGMFYSYAAMTTPDTKDFFELDNDHEIEIVIAQPRLIEGPNFSRWVTTVKELKAFARQLKKAVTTALDENADRKFSAGSHCKFCPGIAGCPEHTGIVSLVTSEEAKKRDVISEDISRYLSLIPELEAWIKAVRALGMELAEGGTHIDGFKLVNKKPTSRWADPVKTEEFFAAQDGIERSEYMDTKVVGITIARKLAKKYKLDIGDLILSKSSGIELVPVEDKREEIVVNPRSLQKLAQILQK